LHKSFVRIFAFVATVAAWGCAEQLETDVACPILCPGQSVALRDTILDVDVIDTVVTLEGFPPRGSTTYHLLANSGDTLDTRVVIRFDSLFTRYTTGGVEIPVTAVDSVFVKIQVDSALSKATSDLTIDVYDVDSDAPDTALAALIPLFNPSRLLGTVTFDPPGLKDSVVIQLANAPVLAKVLANGRLRLGFRVHSADPVRIAVLSANTSRFAILRYDPAPNDPALLSVTIPPRSRTPASDQRLAVDFTDYVIPAVGQPPLPPDVFGVGGIRGRRTYIRFTIPPRFADSVTIVRASLVLHQLPAPAYGFTDSLTVISNVVIARRTVVEIAKAAMITDTTASGGSIFGLPAFRTFPTDDDEERIELVNVARFWTSTISADVPQAIVLRAFTEGRSAAEAKFYSHLAAPGLRPRLLISFLPRSEFGIP
jgi:hypothetical protein